ncbi:MAG: hypothetical protein ACRDK7_03135 [Solirubrobacteraceae bacterium]
MPTAFVAQNGAEIHRSTPIGVTGCPKTKALTRAQNLAKALKACKKKTKGNSKKRLACEAKARKRYLAKALKACKKKTKGNSKKRVVCEAKARKRYGPATKSKKGTRKKKR